MIIRVCRKTPMELAGKLLCMNTSLLLARKKNPKERSVARIISIQCIPEKKINENKKTSIQEEVILVYTKPIFRAKKYELF